MGRWEQYRNEREGGEEAIREDGGARDDIRETVGTKCTTEPHGGVYCRTSTQHKSWIKMKGTNMKQIEYLLSLGHH